LVFVKRNGESWRSTTSKRDLGVSLNRVDKGGFYGFFDCFWVVSGCVLKKRGSFSGGGAISGGCTEWFQIGAKMTSRLCQWTAPLSIIVSLFPYF
jgi:hypothetical protein